MVAGVGAAADVTAIAKRDLIGRLINPTDA